MGYTEVTDVVVPARYAKYQQKMTEQKSRLVEFGVLRRNPEIDAMMAGGGITFNMPGWNDIPRTAANVSSGAAGTPATPISLTTFREIGVRLSRNQSVGWTGLAKILAGSNPAEVIAARWADYWADQAQVAALAIGAGVFADNAANDSGDMSVDIKGVSFVDGVTNFGAAPFVDAVGTMGDSHKALGLVCMHSTVAATARKNDLIDAIKDSESGQVIERYQGRLLIEDDGMPSPSSGVFETWIFGEGAFEWGVTVDDHPIESYRLPLDAVGGGSEVVTTRVQWCIHPRGFAYTGSTADGEPVNGTLDNAGSWNRVAAERKQVKMARLITREF